MASCAAAFNDLKELVKSYADRRELKDLSPVLDVFQRSEEVVAVGRGRQGQGAMQRANVKPAEKTRADQAHRSCVGQ